MNSPKPHIYDVSLEDFEDKVLTASAMQPVLVDLWADWCPPCVVIAPIMEAVVNEREGEVVLAKLEVDEGDNMKIAGRYQVRGFPTILMIYKGEEIGRFSGAKPRAFVEDFIDQSLSDSE